MALNFPSDTTNPYTSPSGVKYIWNTSVGAWEVAIQPPAIVNNTTPTTTNVGSIWWDADDERMYVYSGSSWVLVTEPPTAGSEIVQISETPPATPSLGDLWWDTVSGSLYIYYVDPDGGSFWTDANHSAVGSSSNITISSTQPANAVEGDLWLDSASSILYVYSSGSWASTQAESAGVLSLTVESPLSDSGTSADPVIEISSADTTNKGTVEFAEQAEVDAGTDALKIVTPVTLKSAIENSEIEYTYATDSVPGVVELATQAEAEAGTDTTKVVTPATVAAAITALVSAAGDPTGTVTPFAMNTAPSGYLECDGSDVSRTTYADLYAVLGDLWGAGDGSTTFTLPDLRGEFIRGWDNGRGVDSGRVMATSQSSENLSHTHTAAVTDPGHSHSGKSTSSQNYSSGSGTYVGAGGSTSTNTTGITVDNSTEGGTDFQPRNIALMYCIKT